MHNFKKLRVWQEARLLVADVQQAIRTFPRNDRQVISSQLRRSVLSMPATIAEGCGKESRAETIRYLQMAAGSASETESHLIIAGDLGYLPARLSTELAQRSASIQRMLRSLCINLPS